MTADLFADSEAPGPLRETMGEGAVLLRGKALSLEDEVIAALAAVTARAPFRNMVTPGGFVMSVAMTNCGAAGWVTDRKGYRHRACRWHLLVHGRPAIFHQGRV